MDGPDRYTTNQNADTERQGAKPVFFGFVRGVLRRVSDADLGQVAASVAFYALLGLFPALAAMTAIAGLITDPGMIVLELDRMASILPVEAADIILNQASAVAGQDDSNLTLALVLSLSIALFAARRGTTSLIYGLNLAFGTRENRGIIGRLLAELVLTATLMLGGLLTLGLLVIAPLFLALFPLGGAAGWIIELVRWLVIGGGFILGLTTMYAIGPVRARKRWTWGSSGAVLATMLWFASSLAFTYYVVNFGSYNETFGSLGGVVILLTWLWLSAFIVLLGAAIDAEVEARDENG